MSEIIRSIFEEYENKNDEISIQELKDKIALYLDKIVFYGAGSAGIALFHYLNDVGIRIKYFSDGNPSKWGKTCEGIEIIDYHKINEMIGEDALVVITINTDGKKYCKSFDEALRIGGHGGVYSNLHNCGCKNVIDYTFFYTCRELFKNDKYNLPSCPDVRCMVKHKEDIIRAYDLLIDEDSRVVFQQILRFRLLDVNTIVPTEPQDRQYFDYEDFWEKCENEVFIDCGAYDGISLKAFLLNNKNFKKYIGFEPDISNYTRLKEYIGSLSGEIQGKIKIYPYAMWNDIGEGKFYELSGPGSFVADGGKTVVPFNTIDNILNGECATYVKMNIEGSELKALEGAEGLIREYSPRLAIAGYHKTWDLWEIPLKIKAYNSRYKFKLKSYMNHLSFIYYGRIYD